MVTSTSIKHIGILTNPTKANAEQVRKDLHGWLLKRNMEVLDATETPLEKTLSQA